MNTFLRKERDFSILLLRGAGQYLPKVALPEPALNGRREAARRLRSPSIITVNQRHAGAGAGSRRLPPPGGPGRP